METNSKENSNLAWSQKTTNLVLILIVVGLLIYSNALPAGLFWDDDDVILRNIYIKDWQYLGNFFTHNLTAGGGILDNYWRPLLLIFYSFEWRLFGDWAGGYHFTNIVLHIAAALALFFLLKRLFKDKLVAFMTAAIFLIHPLQTEAVTYVAGRADPLSSLLIFLGLIFYLKKFPLFNPPVQLSRPQNPWLQIPTLALICFGLSLLAKEKAVLLFPALLVIVEFYRFLKENLDQISLNFYTVWSFLKKIIQRIWPVIALAAFYSLLRATVLNFQNTFNLYNEANPYTESLVVRAATFFQVFPQYFELMLFPHNLHMERSVAFVLNFFNPLTLFGLALGLIILILIILCIKKQKPALAFALLWFLATLFPASGLIFPVSGLMYEHYLYLPLIGFFLFLLLLIRSSLKTNSRPALKIFLVALLFGYAIFLGWGTVQRNKDWQDPVTFFNNVIKYNTNSLRVWNNLGMAYAQKGDSAKAITAYEKAIALDPKKLSAPPRHNLARIYTAQNDSDKAEQYYLEAIDVDPHFSYSYYYLLELYLSQNNLTKAEQLVATAQKNYSNADQVVPQSLAAVLGQVKKQSSP